MPIPALQRHHAFLTTNWNAIRNNELSFIIELYWGPIYYFILRTVRNETEAEDLTQDFFTDCLETNRFSKADPARGRFRSFLLSSLKNFLINKHRAAAAKSKSPPGGIVSLQGMAETESAPFEPAHEETPADVFNRNWAIELTGRVFNALEAEYQASGKSDYASAFRRRILDPVLHGIPAPSRTELAREQSVAEKELSNRIITARRAFQRLLRVEIRKYATSEEEVEAEMHDLATFLGLT